MQISDFKGLYYVMLASNLDITPYQIEKQLVLNEITFDQASRLTTLGLAAFEASVRQLEGLSAEAIQVNNWTPVINWHQSAKDAYTNLLGRINSRELYKKIKFHNDVRIWEFLGLIDALQDSGWIERLKESEWSNYVILEGRKENLSGTSQIRNRDGDVIHKLKEELITVLGRKVE